VGVGRVPGPATDDLAALLADAGAHATAWQFFALARGVEQVRPDLPRIGTARDPADEVVDWVHQPSVDFPRSAMVAIEDGTRRPRARSQHLGLLGTMGALPLHLAEAAIAERRGTEPTPFTDFLDLLSARALQAFYRAWASGEPAAQADRPADDRFAAALGAVSGGVSLHFVSGAHRPGVDEPGFGAWRRLAYGGQLTGLNSASAVADVLAHLLGRPVALTEAVGRWRPIPPGERSELARGREGLGTGTTLGRRFFAVEWDVGIEVRARSAAELDELLPGGDAHALLVEAAEAMLPASIDWTVTVSIAEPAVTPARIGSAQLGLTSWVSPRGRRGLRRDVRIHKRKGSAPARTASGEGS